MCMGTKLTASELVIVNFMCQLIHGLSRYLLKHYFGGVSVRVFLIRVGIDEIGESVPTRSKIQRISTKWNKKTFRWLAELLGFASVHLNTNPPLLWS